MNKRYQVFVSSTYSDLSSQRERTIFSLIKAGYIAVGMEQFPSTSETQMEYIERVIDESDYYIVIIRGKYGSTDLDGVSFTEKEFNYATEKKIPCLAFLYKNLDTLQHKEMDGDPDKYKKLLEFRSSLERNRIVSYWSTDEELISHVKDSLNEITRRKPGIGYVRADNIIDVRIVNEKERLTLENETLRSNIKELELQLYQSTDENLKFDEGDEIVDLNIPYSKKTTPNSRNTNEIKYLNISIS